MSTTAKNQAWETLVKKGVITNSNGYKEIRIFDQPKRLLDQVVYYFEGVVVHFDSKPHYYTGQPKLIQQVEDARNETITKDANPSVSPVENRTQ